MNDILVPQLLRLMELDPSPQRRALLRAQFPDAMKQIEQAETPPITIKDVEQAIGRQMQAAIPALAAFADAFRSALPPEELDAFGKYLMGGAAGFMASIQSENFKPVLQLAWDVIKGNENAEHLAVQHPAEAPGSGSETP